MSRSWDTVTPIEAVLLDGIDDWVFASYIDSTVGKIVDGVENRRHMSIGVVAELIVRGWAFPTEYAKPKRVFWDCSPAEAIERVVRDWIEWGDEPFAPGGILWLELTEEGVRLGEALLDELDPL